MITRKTKNLIVRSEDPFNGEPRLEDLSEAYITPHALFYVRNHGRVPEVDPGAYRLEIGGLVQNPLSLSLEEIKDNFLRREITATLECAGNRRHEMTAIAEIPGEIPWSAGAIGTAAWAGAALGDVLRAAGVQEGTGHADLEGMDPIARGGRVAGFGGSIPIQKALAPEVILAYEMNGEPLTPLHGFPLRLIAPGYIGARSVKWLKEIRLQPEPSQNYFYAHAYQLFPARVQADSADWSEGLKLGEMNVNAVICAPAQAAVVRAETGMVELRGYAIAGSRPIARVEVSLDDGRTWSQARLRGGSGDNPWCWVLWAAQAACGPGSHQAVVRAWDSAANCQPEEVGGIWNFKGYANNAWHRIQFVVE